jgi:hypothetical protein
MAGAVPGITLTANLQDICGNHAGTTANPAVLRIALAGFGLTLPCIVGTSNIAQTGPEDFYDTGSGISVQLWGNYQIFPAGTYYAITVLDGAGNIVQTGAYQFTEEETFDLSQLAQIYPVAPTPPLGVAVLTNPPMQGSQTIDGPLIVDGNLMVTGAINSSASIIDVTSSGGAANFDLTLGSCFRIVLDENVTAVAFNSPLPGLLYTFIVVQDGTGGRTFAWPDIALNPVTPVNPVANGKTVWTAICDEDGTLMSNGYFP